MTLKSSISLEVYLRTASWSIDELKQRLRMSGSSWVMSSMRQPYVSGVVDSSESVMLFCTHSPAIFSTCCYQLDSNLANLVVTVEMGQILEFFFCNNSMVARIRWAFPVWQGSVEKLSRWGGECLHNVAANIFRKRRTRFRHDLPIFIKNITKTFCFFLDTLYMYGIAIPYMQLFQKCRRTNMS